MTLSAITLTPKYTETTNVCVVVELMHRKAIHWYPHCRTWECSRKWLRSDDGGCSFRQEIPDTSTLPLNPGSQLVSLVRGLEIYRYVTEIPCIYTSSHLSSHYFRPMCSEVIMISSRLVNG